MTKDDFRIEVGNKIRTIRFQHRNKYGRSMNQTEFCELLNETEPTDLIIKPVSLGMYERGTQNCGSDKYEKILRLDKNK